VHLLKSHIKAYTKKNGNIVTAHEDSRGRENPANKHYLSEETTNSIIQQYKNSKLTLPQIAEKHSCSANGVRSILTRYNVPLRERGDKEEVAQRYKEGKSTKQIADEMGIPQTTVIRWMRNEGLIRSMKIPLDLQNEMVRLYTEDQMSPTEIGKRLNTSTGSVAGQVKKAGALRTQSEASAIKAKKNYTPRGIKGWWQSTKTGLWEHAGSITEILRMQQLDADGTVKTWTKNVPIIKYGDRRYLPDFLVEYNDGRKEIEEVKWKCEHDYAINQTKWQAATEYCHARGWTFKIVSEEDVGGSSAVKNFKYSGLQKYKSEDRRQRENELALKRYHRDKEAGKNPSYRPGKFKKAIYHSAPSPYSRQEDITMNKIEELLKAIEDAAQTGPDLLRKSQMGFDFAAPATATSNPHHAAYTRTNARGTTSQIQAKGAPTQPQDHHAMVKELHDAFEKHDKRGRGGLGISTDHPDYSTPEKYLQTAKNILKYQGHERLGKRGADEVGGMLNRHISELEGSGTAPAGGPIANLHLVPDEGLHQLVTGLANSGDNAMLAQVGNEIARRKAAAEDEQPVAVQEAKVDAGYRIPQRPTYPAPNSMTTADIKKIIESREAYTEDFLGDLKAGDKTELVWSSGKKQEITIQGEDAAPLLHGRPDTRHQKYEEGKAAKSAGKSERANPYTDETFENMAWHHGWSGDTKSDGSPIDNPYPKHQGAVVSVAPEIAHLITQVDAAATGLLAHPQMQQHRAEVEQMIHELHQYPSAGHAKAIVERLKDMGEDVSETK